MAQLQDAKYDDQVDSTSQALAWLKQRTQGWGIQEYYRQQAEALGAPTRPAIIRVKPFIEAMSFSTMSGQLYYARPDGTFELSEEDAIPLLMAGGSGCHARRELAD